MIVLLISCSIKILILPFIQDSKIYSLLPLFASNLLSGCEENWQISGFLHLAESNPLDFVNEAGVMAW